MRSFREITAKMPQTPKGKGGGRLQGEPTTTLLVASEAFCRLPSDLWMSYSLTIFEWSPTTTSSSPGTPSRSPTAMS